VQVDPPLQRTVPIAKSMRRIIHLWEIGDPDSSIAPLRDWATVYGRKTYGRSGASYLSHIKYIYDKWKNDCREDFDEFERRYPGTRDLAAFTIYHRIKKKEGEERNASPIAAADE